MENNKKFTLKTNVTPILLVLNEAYWILNVLNALDGRFERIIIFDAGSNDGTAEGIKSYTELKDLKSTYLYESFPKVDPRAQLAYRNAPIAEVTTDFYLLVDGDEIWNKESLDCLEQEFPKFVESNKLYGIVNRIEICESLKEAYTEKSWVPHHRLYHRSCTWKYTHPGERARIKQTKENEFNFSKNVYVYHLHNTLRSPDESYALERIKRKTQHTYHPGQSQPFNILEKIPLLNNPYFIYHKGKALIQPELDKILKELGIELNTKN